MTGAVDTTSPEDVTGLRRYAGQRECVSDMDEAVFRHWPGSGRSASGYLQSMEATTWGITGPDYTDGGSLSMGKEANILAW